MISTDAGLASRSDVSGAFLSGAPSRHAGVPQFPRAGVPWASKTAPSSHPLSRASRGRSDAAGSSRCQVRGHHRATARRGTTRSTSLLGSSASRSEGTAISWSAVGMAFAVATATGLFFGIYPASRASKLRPIDALHYE